MKKFIKLSLFSCLLFTLIIINSCRQPSINNNPNLLMGNPSQATNDPNNSNNYLIIKPQYALAYSKDKGTANWVSWQLNSTWLGDTPRQDNFRSDTSLPEGWYKVKTSDYTGTGFDRGHLVSSEDRGKTTEDNSATFLMTNIIPQAPDNNRGVWVQLENYCRDLVKKGKELYIIAGGYDEGGIGLKGIKKTLANGKVIVPKYVWKVILILNQPNSNIQAVTTNTRSIAVVIPNEQGVNNKPWQKYQKSIDDVEKLTGYDFFSNVPKSIQEAIEKRIDN